MASLSAMVSATFGRPDREGQGFPPGRKIHRKLNATHAASRNADPEALIGDKAYDADPFVEALTQRAGHSTQGQPKHQAGVRLHCECNLVERFFNLLKHLRAIATRYDKLARNFLAGLQLAAVTILLN